MLKLFELLGTIAVENNEAISAINETTQKVESSSSAMISAFKKVGTVIATVFALDKIKDFGVNIVQTAANVQAENAQFEASFKEYADSATQMFNRVGEATGVFASRLRVTGTKAFSQFKGAGLDANEALANTETFLGLASDAAAYYDISLEDAEARIRSFLRGNVEAGDAIGLFTSESQRNSYAVDMYGKKWINLTEAQKQNLMLKVAEDIYSQSGAIGQASRESDGLANVTGNLKETWRQFLAVIGAPVLKAVTPILQNLSTKVQELQGKWQDFQTYLENDPAIQNLKTRIQDVIQTIKDLGTWLVDNKDKIFQLVQAIGVLVIAWAGFKVGSAIQTMVQGFQAARIQLALYSMEVGKAGLAQGLFNGSLTLGQTIVGLFTGQIKLTTLATNAWKTAQTKLNAVLLANPIGIIVAAIAALIAIFVIAYNKSDTFKKAVDELWKSIKEGLAPVFEALKPLLKSIIDLFKSVWSLISSLVIPIFKSIINVITQIFQVVSPILQKLFSVFSTVFGGIAKVVSNVINVITGIINAITKAVNAVKEGIEKIKGFFKFKWELPKLKAPKFSINPKGWKVGDLLKGVIPKLGVTWNADGAIFTKPTIFDTAYGLQGVGEAGAEAVLPINKLEGYVRNAVQAETRNLDHQVSRIYTILANYLPAIADNANSEIRLDGDVLVGQLAPKIDKELGKAYARKVRY